MADRVTLNHKNDQRTKENGVSLWWMAYTDSTRALEPRLFCTKKFRCGARITCAENGNVMKCNDYLGNHIYFLLGFDPLRLHHLQTQTNQQDVF